MAKKKTTADKQIEKAIISAAPKNIREVNNLFQTGSTSGKIKEKESAVKAKSLPVKKSSSGDIEIQAPDKVIADFIKSGENKVGAEKKKNTINEYKRTNNREENLARQKFGNAPTGDIRLSPAYVGSFEKDGRAQRPSPTGVNAFEEASRRFAQKNDQYTNSPYYGKSYAELTNLRKGIDARLHSGKITQAQAEKEKNTIDMWRASAASKDELSEMLREAEEYKKHYTGIYNDAQMKQTGYSRGMFSAEIKDANEKRLSDAKEKLSNIETLIGQIKSQQDDYEAQESYDENLVKWGKVAIESGASDKYKPTKYGATEYDLINKLRNGELKEDAPVVESIKNSLFGQMTDGELRLYNTLYNVDVKKADAYLKDIEGVLKRRLSNMQTEEAYEYAQEHPLLGGARSVVQNVAMGLPAAVDNVVENITGDIDTYDDTSRILRTSQALREGGAQYFTERFGETGGLLYNTGVSIVENLANVLLFKGAGKASSALISANMATSAASNAMISAADRGGNDKQILMSGVASGLAEYLFEKISIDRLLSPQKTKGIVKNALIQSGVEGSEETFTEIANIISDSLIMQGQSENARKRREYVMQGMSAEEATKKVMQESVVQVAMAAASGALSGGVMGAGAGVVNNVSHSFYITRLGEKLIKNPDRLNRILQIGVENGNADIKREGTETLPYDTTGMTARQAGKMAEGIITDALTQKGDIASIARIIGALEGRDASYLGSKESFDTARAVLHFVNESTTKEDTALLERSSGAVTLLTAIEGDTKAWNNVKSEAVKDAEHQTQRKAESSGIEIEKPVTEYPYDVKKVITDYVNSTNKKLVDFAKKVLGDKNIPQNEKYYFEGVTERAAKDIEDITGIDTRGFKSAIEARMIWHIDKDHGSNGAADQSMANIEDIGRMEYVLNNYDSISYGGRAEAYTSIGKNGKPKTADTVVYSKKINGTYYLVQAVPDTKSKTLYVVSAYINKKGASQLVNAEKAPTFTPETASVITPSDTMVSQDEGGVKGKETIPQSPDGDKREGAETLPYSSEKYDIPEGSEIVNNIVVDEYSKKVMAEKPRAYSNIIRMARRMGMNVRFVKGLTDENGKVLDGLITSKGVFINADAKNPSRFAATHEFGHRMKQAAPKEWAKYQEYVINKLKKESFDGEKTAYDVLYEETRNAYGKDDTDYINEEIAVNYAGELFDNEEMLEEFIREDKSLALRVRDWWYNVLESMGLLSEKKKAQQMWLRAYTAAGKNVKDGKVGAYSDEKFKYVGKTDDGRKIYRTNYKEGTPKSIKQNDLIDIIQNIWSKKPIHLTIKENGVYKEISANFNPELSERSDLSKIVFGNRKGNGSEKRMTLDLSTDLYQIASDAKQTGSKAETGKDNKAHDGVKHWYYFITNLVYEDVSGKQIDCYMNIDVKENQSGHYFYSFAIEKGTAPQTLLAVVSDEMSPTVPTDNSISNDNPIVNSQSMQNLKKNTKKEQLDIINQNNPAPNSYLTWIRTEDDIKTLSEALDDSDYRYDDEFIPDYTRKMAEQALATGKITVYSSYPITQGTFVTPSKMEAESYSGTGKVYEKTVKIKDVAWIDPTQGQYARIEEGKVGEFSNEKYYINPTFNRAFDNWDKNLKRRSGITLKVGRTSEPLISIGVHEQEIKWDTTKINDTLKTHPDIDLEMLKSIPNLIENPILIMEEHNKKANKEHGNNRIFVLGELYNENNLPIVAFLELEPTNKDGIYLNEIKIVSTHSRVDETAPESFERTRGLVKNSHLLYLDPNKNRTNNWLARTGLQLPFLPTTYGPINKITYTDDFVNTNSMQNTAENTQEGKKSIAGLSLSEIEARETARKLERENAELKKQLENTRAKLSAEKKGIDLNSIRKAVQKIKNAYGSKISTATLYQDFVHLCENMTKKNASISNMNAEISAIARKVIENATETIDTGEYADLLDTIRNTRIAVPEDDKASFADGYEHFRKRNMGKIKLAKDGYPLDALWDDLVQEYPYLFSEEITGSEARLNEILRMREKLLPFEESIYKTGEEVEIAVKALEIDIMESFERAADGGGEYVFYYNRAAEAEQKLKERIVVLGEKNENLKKQLEKAKNDYKNRIEDNRQKNNDRFSRSELRKNIDRDFRYLYSMFHNPTDNRHIPEGLRKSVGELLRCFNFETKRLDGIRNEGKEAKSPTAARLNAMADAFEKILRNVYANTAEMEAFTDEYLKEELEELKENIPADDKGEAKRLEDMNIEELQTMEKVLKTIHHIITKGNEAFSSEIRETISAISDKAMSEMKDKRDTRINPEKTDAHKVLNDINEYLHIDNIKPWEMFNELGGTFAELYRVMREGFNKHIKNIKEASEVIKDAIKDLDKKEITGKGSKKYTFTLESGKNIELSKGQIMCLYALYQRKQGREHILYGGIVTKTIAKTKEGKKQNIENIHAVTQKDLGEMFEKLSREETETIKKIVEFMSTTCARWGNETSMKLFGYEKYGETWYFPIKVAKGTLQKYVGSQGEGNSKNQSFTKGTVPKARNAVEIGDFLDVVANHINGMSVYNALTPILLDVQRVLNYKQEIDGFSPTYLNEEFKKTYGVKVLEYVEKFIADVDGVRKATDKSGAGEKLLSISKKAAIALNIRVFVQQWTSVARALMFLSPADLTMTPAKVSKLKKEMLEEMPIAYWKHSGFRDLYTGGNVKDVLLDNESKWDKLTMGMYGWADDNTLARIYGAVKKEVGRNNPTLERDSAEFKRKVRERFDYVVDRTQVVDSPFHKSQNMRSEKYDKKIVTSFMSEPLTNFNLYRSVIMDAINEGDATKKMARATAVFVVSNLLLAMSQSVPDAWREDDDDELFTEDGEKISYLSRYLKKTGENLLNNSNPLTYVPYVKEIVSIIDGFSVERMEYSNISKLMSAAKKIADEDIPTPKRILNFAAAAAAVFGLPTHTLMRDVKGLYRTIYGAIGEEYAEYAITKLNWDVRKIDNKEKFMKHYKRALQNGHSEVAQLILEDYLASNFKGKDFENENSAAVTAAMADVYSATKDNRAMYALPENEFKYAGQEITLSEKDYEEYAEKRNSTLWQIAYDFVTSEGYKNLTDEEKAKGFGEITDYSEKVVLQNYIKDYAIPDWQMKLEEGEISYIDRAVENHENNILKELAMKMYEKTTSESYSDEAYEKDIKKYTDKENGYGYSRDEVIDAVKAAGRATPEYKKYKSDINRNFKYDKEGMSDTEIEKMESLRTSASKYYADEKFLREGGDNRHMSIYDDELSEKMSLEQYLTHHAKAKTTAAMADGKENMKSKELQTYLNSTDYTTAIKAALFRAIGDKGWKNPYDGTKNP